MFLLRFACVHISHFCILPFAFSLLPFAYVPNDDVLASSQSVYSNCLELLAIRLVWAALMVNAREWLSVVCNYCRQIMFKFKAVFNTTLACDNATNIFDTAIAVETALIKIRSSLFSWRCHYSLQSLFALIEKRVIAYVNLWYNFLLCIFFSSNVYAQQIVDSFSVFLQPTYWRQK